MEEQRQRQEEEQRRAQAESAQETETATPAVSTVAPTSDEAMLERALALSTETPVKRNRVRFVSILSLDFVFLASKIFLFSVWNSPRFHEPKILFLWF